MPYQTAFTELVYAAESGEPAVVRFRIALSDPPGRIVVLHVVHDDQYGVSPVANAIARDRILNRVLDIHLSGQAISALLFVVEDSGGRFEYGVNIDSDDYVRRGNPYVARPAPGPRGSFTEELSIDSADLITGRMRVGTLHSPPVAVSLEAEQALA